MNESMFNNKFKSHSILFQLATQDGGVDYPLCSQDLNGIIQERAIGTEVN